ncbi:MAG TPA: redoxin domain-containing protein [Verrucomicrobiae bacterium]|nr:redoxin domain-containing protein [Verrucomicrobiae bacterium]
MRRALSWLGLMASVTMAYGAAEIGQPVPDFTATDINGQTHKLSDYKGKIVILESYNQDCPFCHNHYRTGAMQELQGDMTSKGVVWLVVNSVGEKYSSHRSPETARKEWAEQKMKATAWLDDSSGEIGKKYGMRTTPHMFVIDPKGILVYQGAIDDRAEPEGDPRTARNYVREAVQRLQAGEAVTVSQTRPYGCGVKYGS